MNPIFTRNLFMNQGADYSITLIVEDAQGNPITNIVSSECHMRTHERASYGFPLSCTFQDSAFTISASANETAVIPSGRYKYTVNYTDSNGIVTRLLDGIMTVRESMIK